MSVRFRRSMKIGPGVRMTFGKKSGSVSLGGRGYRYTVSTTGRRTTSLGLPGTGLGWTGSSKRTKKATGVLSPGSEGQPGRIRVEGAVPGAGLFASASEKEFRRGVIAVAKGDFASAATAFDKATSSDTKNISDDLFFGFVLSKLDRDEEAIVPLERVVASDVSLPDALMKKYAARLEFVVTAEIVPGIVVDLPFDSSGAAVLLAEIYQKVGRFAEAADLLEGLGDAGLPESVAATSLAELYAQQALWDEVLRVTDGITNTDDLDAVCLTYRASAFFQQGLLDAALVSLREALRSSKRTPAVLWSARYLRARVYEAQGQKAKARKDYETIVASSPDFEDIRERLAGLSS